MKRFSLVLVGLGSLALFVGAGTSDMKTELGVSTPFDGVALAVVGFAILLTGIAILVEKTKS